MIDVLIAPGKSYTINENSKVREVGSDVRKRLEEMNHNAELDFGSCRGP